MRLINIEENNDTISYVFQAPFKYSFWELLDFINAANSKFYNSDTVKFTFDKNGTTYPIPQGKIYNQPKRHGVGITGMSPPTFQNVPVTFSAIADTKCLKLSFDINKIKDIVDDMGQPYSQDDFKLIVTDAISRIEIYGNCLTERCKAGLDIKKQIKDYVEEPDKNNIIQSGPLFFDITDVLFPKDTEK